MAKKIKVQIDMEIDDAALGVDKKKDIEEAVEIALKNGMSGFLHWKFLFLRVKVI